MLPFLFSAALCVLPQDVPPVPKPTPPAAQPLPPAESKPLGFASFKLPFKWDTLIPVNGVEVDGLKVVSIFFNKRAVKVWPLKGTDFGTRARIEVSNNAAKSRVPGFAVAVFDSEDRLMGVATGGTKLGTVGAGTTETFDLNFHQVLERLPLGDHFYLSVELTD